MVRAQRHIRQRKSLFMRSVLLLSLAVAVAAPAALAQDAASCGFDYVVEGGLIAEAFSEVPLTPDLIKVALSVRAA